jgi:hypothetical protein
MSLNMDHSITGVIEMGTRVGEKKGNKIVICILLVSLHTFIHHTIT